MSKDANEISDQAFKWNTYPLIPVQSIGEFYE